MPARPDVGAGRRTSALLLLVAALLVTLPGTARAEVQLLTPFPAVEVEAGETVTLDLEVRSSVRQRVDLEVVSAPAGWQTTLRGGGFVVRGVTTDPDEPPRVSMNVEVPADAAAGNHDLVVEARAADGTSDRLTVTLIVAEEVAGAVTVEAEFPRQSIRVDETITFNLTLRNDTPRETTFALAAAGPPGWQVEARPSAEQRATTVSVEGGGTSTINVRVTPAAEATAGEYPIEVEVSGGGETATTTLTVEIIGSFVLTLTTPTERLNANGVAGRETRVDLVVRNDGTAPLTDVSLSATPPSGWEVTFEPESLPEVAAGQQATATALVVPAEEAVVGDYVLTLRASGEGRSDSVEIRFAVETSTAWGLVGILLIAGAVGGLLWVFRQYGRR